MDSATPLCSRIIDKEVVTNQALPTASSDSIPSLTSGEDSTLSCVPNVVKLSDIKASEAHPYVGTSPNLVTSELHRDPEHSVEFTVESNPPNQVLSPVCCIDKGPQGCTFILVNAQAQIEPPLNYDFTISKSNLPLKATSSSSLPVSTPDSETDSYSTSIGVFPLTCGSVPTSLSNSSVSIPNQRPLPLNVQPQDRDKETPDLRPGAIF